MFMLYLCMPYKIYILSYSVRSDLLIYLFGVIFLVKKKKKKKRVFDSCFDYTKIGEMTLLN